jgi:hypothetical protein
MGGVNKAEPQREHTWKRKPSGTQKGLLFCLSWIGFLSIFIIHSTLWQIVFCLDLLHSLFVYPLALACFTFYLLSPATAKRALEFHVAVYTDMEVPRN